MYPIINITGNIGFIRMYVSYMNPILDIIDMIDIVTHD